MRPKILIFLLTISFWSCQKQSPELQFFFVDPLEKIFPEAAYFVNEPAHADAVRGEHASFQFAVRSNSGIKDLGIRVSPPEKDGVLLSDIKKGFVGYVKVGRSNPEPSKDILRSSSGYFPDPILYKESTDVSFGTTQPIWLTVKIPTDAPTGVYHGTAEITGEIDGNVFVQTMPFTLEVFKPVIHKTSLWVTNWFFLDNLKYLNNNEPVEEYSDIYWKLARVMAGTLADYRQNMAMISPLDHTRFEQKNGVWSFDFTNFNKLVSLFIEEGVIGRLEGGHLGNRIDGSWDGPFGLKIPIIEKDTTYMETKSISNSETKNFYDQFLPALLNNIESNGWSKLYVQHIADEPIDANVDSYIEISDYIRGKMPNVKIIEACHTSLLKGKIDIWVPQMNYLNEDLDFYKEQQANGDEAWYYTCLAPKGEYANRFVEQPLIKTRLLHWVNHKYGIPGYLHWGFNYWDSKGGITVDGNPYSDVSGLIGSSGNVLPGGDCWISYPAKDEIFPSIRLEAMRDGIVDYELLKMYAEKFPEEAKEMVGTTVYNFEHYDTNIGDFRKKRRKMLEKLSE